MITLQKVRIGLGIVAGIRGALTNSDIYLIKKIRENVSCLYIACDITQVKSIQILKKYVDGVYFFPKIITEIYSYKFLLSAFKKKNIKTYDELILFNNSLFGPFYDLNNIFHNMQVKKCDFWGLLHYGDRVNNSWKILPDQLNEGFLVVRSSLFKMVDFFEFFSDENREMVSFLNYFSHLGYRYSTYVEDSLYLSILPQNNFDVERYMSYKLIRDLKYPFLKKSCFKTQNNDFDYGIGDNLSKVMNYIKNDLSYDINMIWENILHTYNIADLHRLLHLEYVLPWQKQDSKINSKDLYNQTVVIIYLYYMDLLDEEFDYIANIPKKIDIIIISQAKNKSLLERYAQCIGRNIQFLAAGPKGRDVSALLITAHPYLMKYAYVCFIHDKKTTGNAGSVTIGEAFQHIIWGNLLKSENYIDNILNTFIVHSRLGVLAPPEPEHADYFSLLGNRWAAAKDATQKLLHELDINIPLTDDNDPFALSTSFWCRSAALKKLFTFTFEYEEFPDEPMPLDGTISHAVERCLVYVAQDAGYFSGIVENSDYAELRIANLQRMLSKVVSLESRKHYFTSFRGMCESYNKESIINFCKKYKSIYIYGAGSLGHKLYSTLKNNGILASGFIISDGQKMKEKLPIPCCYLSQLDVYDNVGIIVAATKKYKGEMVKQLLNRGWKEFFCKDV